MSQQGIFEGLVDVASTQTRLVCVARGFKGKKETPNGQSSKRAEQ